MSEGKSIDLPPPSHRHPMSGEPIWDANAVQVAVLNGIMADREQRAQPAGDVWDKVAANMREAGAVMPKGVWMVMSMHVRADPDGNYHVMLPEAERSMPLTEKIGGLKMDLMAADEAIEAPALTWRQMEVLKLLAEGLPAKSIARQLNASVFTVKTHLQGIYNRLGKRNSIGAVMEARRLGILK